MSFAYSESARLVRSALGAVLRQRREAARRTLTEVAGEAGLSPAHLSEVERGRKEVSTERLLSVAHALGTGPADIYADLARLLGADPDRPAWPEDPPAKLRLATASLPLEALRSVADFSAYLAMAHPPPRPKARIGFDTGGASGKPLANPSAHIPTPRNLRFREDPVRRAPDGR